MVTDRAIVAGVAVIPVATVGDGSTVVKAIAAGVASML